MTEAQRKANIRWKERHPERYRQYQREYKRRIRAQKKDADEERVADGALTHQQARTKIELQEEKYEIL